ncbi:MULTISPECIES: lipopolysaccharide biosynthesis protein [unclassified Agarivorans]|uniref:lipopolysaccharide biosynthesis protein n=1 Tax=unclassified Agarivorans TaxID=2636026 RepID=UPI003D7E17A5
MTAASKHTNLKSQVLTSLKWVVAGKIATQTLRWVMTFWVIRLLSPEDYGLVAMADVLSGFFVLILGSLFSSSLIQHQALNTNILKQMFGAIIVVHLSIFSLQYLLAGPVSHYYQSPEVAAILKVNAWCVLIMAFEIIPAALLAKEMDFKRVSIIEGIANAAAAVTTLILAYLGYGFWALIYGQVLFYLLKASMVMAIRPITYWPSFSYSEISGMLKFGGGLSLLTIMFYIFSHIDIVIAGRVMTPVEVGLYAICLQIAMMPQKKIMPILRQVAFPAFAKIQDQPKMIASYVIKSQKLCLLITLPIFWGLAATVEQLIPLVLGEKWLDAVTPATLILLVMPLRFSEELFNPALKSLKKVRHMLINATILLTVLVPSIYVGSHHGAHGLAMAWLCAFPVAYLIVVLHNSRGINIPLLDLFKHIAVPAFAGALMMLSIYYSKPLLADFSAIVILLFSILIGASVYLTGLLIIDRKVFQEAKQLLKRA